jgi:hypothetical protein
LRYLRDIARVPDPICQNAPLNVQKLIDFTIKV